MSRNAVRIWENQYECLKKVPTKKLQAELALAMLDYAFSGKHDELKFPLDAIIQPMYAALVVKNQGGAPAGNNNRKSTLDTTVDITVIIFCNPPYSEYENWTNRIIREGNFEQAFLIIPNRWKDNADIQASLKATKTQAYVLKTMDFLNAERQARATVDIVKLTRNRYSWNSEEHKSAFDLWFEETFAVSSENKFLSEYEEEKKQTELVKNTLISAPNKIEALMSDKKIDNSFYEVFSGVTDYEKVSGLMDKFNENIQKQVDGKVDEKLKPNVPNKPTETKIEDAQLRAAMGLN